MIKEPARRQGYVAVVLVPEDAARLRATACFPVVYAHHITLAYRPTEAEFAPYAAMLGQVVEAQVLGVVRGRCLQVVVVDGVATNRLHPHIVVSCAEGVPPNAGNALLESDRVVMRPHGLARVRGRVEFVPFESTQCRTKQARQRPSGRN